MPPHLVLVGLPGAGKSTAGEIVARLLGCRALDLDAEIEQRAGRSVAEIFTALGEAAFRRMEREVTRSVVDLPPMVLTPGGGWMVDPSNREAVRGRGRIIYLRVSPATAVRRLGSGASSRPLLQGDAMGAMERLKAEREPIYRASDAVIDTERIDSQQVALSIRDLAAEWGWQVG